MNSKVLTSIVLGFCLLCGPAIVPASAAEAPKTGEHMDKAKAGEAMDKGKMADHMAAVHTAKKDAAAKAGVPEIVDTLIMTVMPPTADIVITMPLVLVERGIVEAVTGDTFTLKRQDGSVAKIMINNATVIENVYADIFNWKSAKGISDLKKGDKVRARVFPPNANGSETALLVDVFHW